MEVQLIPIPQPVKDIPGRRSTAKNELVFRATALPPLGFKSYYVKKVTGDMISKPVTQDKHFIESEVSSIRINLQ